jgi:hypothetical protein
VSEPASEGSDVADDAADVYGGDSSSFAEPTFRDMSARPFLPWHYPVKQLVRDLQWGHLTRRLLRRRPAGAGILNYLTLPGADMLDVRVLSRHCHDLGTKVRYFGFDSSAPKRRAASAHQITEDRSRVEAGWFASEAMLRQSGRITDDSVMVRGRLEDIVPLGSVARSHLTSRGPFDVVNIDACDHLAYRPPQREHSTFDALRTILEHQLLATQPWLLFVTTRVDPDLLDGFGEAFKSAIETNLVQFGATFAQELATTLQLDVDDLPGSLDAIWGQPGHEFLKLYTVGFGKHLLRLLQGQPNHPTKVELASCATYRVHGESPDMLSLAFRFIPMGPVLLETGQSGSVKVSPIEPALAQQVARQARKLLDLDEILRTDQTQRENATTSTASLLAECGYDVTSWELWCREHPRSTFQDAVDTRNQLP